MRLTYKNRTAILLDSNTMSATQTISDKTLNTQVYISTIALKELTLKEHSLAPQPKTKPTLLNEIASSASANADATSTMRHKISLDLHDSTIQPYIGLKLGLEALRRKIPEGAALAAELDELVMMAEESIAELRQYIGGLKSQIKPPLNPQLKPQLITPLVDAIIELAKKYQLRHRIDVRVNADTQLQLSAQLSTEIYQLVCEGLSNIHRHTQSKKAEINLYHLNGQLVIEVINQDVNTKDFSHFKPRSMAERVSNLGGKVSVYHIAGDNTTASKALGSKTLMGKTIVTAKIPLQLTQRLL